LLKKPNDRRLQEEGLNSELIKTNRSLWRSSSARHAGLEEPVPHRDAGASRFYLPAPAGFRLGGRNDKQLCDNQNLYFT
jgi:hypothetical protein